MSPPQRTLLVPGLCPGTQRRAGSACRQTACGSSRRALRGRASMAARSQVECGNGRVSIPIHNGERIESPETGGPGATNQAVRPASQTLSQRHQDRAMDELTEYLASSGEDGFWEQIQTEARGVAEHEPMLVSFLFASVLRHRNLEEALGVILANKLQTPDLSAILFRDLFNEAMAGAVSIPPPIPPDPP